EPRPLGVQAVRRGRDRVVEALGVLLEVAHDEERSVAAKVASAEIEGVPQHALDVVARRDAWAGRDGAAVVRVAEDELARLDDMEVVAGALSAPFAARRAADDRLRDAEAEAERLQDRLVARRQYGQDAVERRRVTQANGAFHLVAEAKVQRRRVACVEE